MKVLVACHTLMDEHWLDIPKEVTRLTAESGKHEMPVYHTMDIMHPHRPNIFDMQNWYMYVESNHSFYDVIFLPGCGGEWYDIQKDGGSCDVILVLLVPALYLGVCLSPHQETSRLQRARDGRVSKHTGREQHTVPLSTAAGAGSLQPGDTNETTQAITNPSFGIIHCAHAHASSWTGDNRPEGRYQVSDDRKVRSM